MKFTVKLGGMNFINVKNIMMFRGEPLFTVYRSESDGALSVNFEVFDSNGNKLASVKQNRIYPHHEQAKNLQLGGNASTYTLTDTANNKMLVRIDKREAAETELDVFLHTYLPNGVLFNASPDGTSLASHFFKGVTIADAGVGVNIG
ncbi:MAG: hypothetical protein LAP21_21535 [Acidobacteriia bacterium]|nr:hypothetical protein [Terriglobia bacterium]